MDPTPANLERVYRALFRFGAPAHVLEALRNLAPDEVLWMGNPPVRVDILQSVAGLDYERAFEHREQLQWHGVPVTMIGREELMRSKRAAGRPQDLIDLANLEGDESEDDF